MKIFIRALVFFFFFFFFLSTSNFTRVFASPYGSCAYGNGTYNEACGSSGSGGGGSAPSSGGIGSISTFCTAQAPSSAPDLFQIDTTNTTAALFLAPAGKPYTNYSFSYGTTADANMYGGGFNQSNASGAISFTIQSLSPNTIYYFKINASNGCAAGPSSAVVKAKTTASKNQKGTYYKNTLTAVTSTVASVFNQSPTSKVTKLPVQTTSELAPITPSDKKVPAPKSQSAPKASVQKKSSGFLSNIFSEIKSLFKF